MPLAVFFYLPHNATAADWIGGLIGAAVVFPLFYLLVEWLVARERR